MSTSSPVVREFFEQFERSRNTFDDRGNLCRWLPLTQVNPRANEALHATAAAAIESVRG